MPRGEQRVAQSHGGRLPESSPEVSDYRGGVLSLTLNQAWILVAAIVAGLVLGRDCELIGRSGGRPDGGDPNLRVSTVVGGLVTPNAIAFLGLNDFLVAEKNTAPRRESRRSLVLRNL